jgi:hypothetical protein
MDRTRARWSGWAAVAGAVLGAVLTPLHAMARHATADGEQDLALPWTRAWSEPLSAAVRPLLNWSDPDTVYVTYGKGWLVVLAAVALCAVAVRRRRSPHGAETWGWRLALPAYALTALAALVTYWTPWWLDIAFVVLAVPGLVLTVVGSTVLGVALLRRGFRPRLTAWLLALTVPLFLVLAQVVSFGGTLMPVVLAWAVAGWSLASGQLDRPNAAATSVRTASSRRRASVRA